QRVERMGRRRRRDGRRGAGRGREREKGEKLDHAPATGASTRLTSLAMKRPTESRSDGHVLRTEIFGCAFCSWATISGISRSECELPRVNMVEMTVTSTAPALMAAWKAASRDGAQNSLYASRTRCPAKCRRRESATASRPTLYGSFCGVRGQSRSLASAAASS